MTDDHDGCKWVNVSSDTCSPGLSIECRLTVRYCLINCNQQFAKRDQFCCRKVSFFNMTTIFTTQHTCQTVEKIEEMGWELLLHRQYSPDLASSDFVCLDHSRNHLEALFENNEEGNVM